MSKWIVLIACVFTSVPVLAYTSSTGHFSCPNPLENSLGVRVQEGEALVSFSNDYGERYRVETIPLTAAESKAIKDYGYRSYLHDTMNGFYLPNTIFRSVPDAERLSEEYYGDVRGGAVMVQFLLKGAGLEKTHIDLKTNKTTVVRLDTVRSVLIFQEQGLVVFVSSELSPVRPDQDAPTASENAKRAKRLTDQTIRFANQITIQK